MAPKRTKLNNIPIPSAMKSAKIKVNEPIDERCWAFMKELREHHKTKQIFDCNPYAEVYQLRQNLYGILTEHLRGGGDPWSYLLIGPEKAMLMDTGWGAGDLKGVVDALTGGMPLIVANTHAHGDHASGNCQFERVYCHEYAVPGLRAMRTPDLWNDLFDAEGQCIWTQFDRTDTVPFHEYEIVGCPDGHVFDLGGGYEVELIHTAGHRPGHCMFLDRNSRLLFAGDDAISMRISIGAVSPGEPYEEYATVKAYRDCMARLAARMDEYDYVFPGHFVYDLESNVIANLVEAAEAILADPLRPDWAEEAQMRDATFTRYHKFVEGLGTLAYTESSVGA